MKNKIILKLIIFFLFLFTSIANSEENFKFDVTEIEILEKGNLFKGLKRGKIESDDGIILYANEFEYNKIKNTLKARGNVQVLDNINRNTIYTDNITYFKNKNLIVTNGNSRFINTNDNLEISAEIFEYHKFKNKVIAKNNVIAEDKIQKYKIFSNNITYLKSEEKIYTKDKTKILIQDRYEFNSKDVVFLKNEMELISENKSTILDKKSKFYSLSNFKYLIRDKELRGENITFISNYNLPKSDKYYFSSGIINLHDNKFFAKDTKIKVHKDIFDNTENDPRIAGVSSRSDGNVTFINKGVFTSCKKTDKCPPWSITAEKISHNKEKKQIDYNQAFLKVYDVPVFYFPKFFHPDPTVERQSGFLQPSINNSNILGSSFTLPYFNIIDLNTDLTFKPTYFDKNIFMIQNEFRHVNKNTSIIGDFGFVKNFKSTVTKEKKNINHIFGRIEHNLDLNDYISSELNISIERINNDGYLKIFEPHITKSSTRPNDPNVLNNKIEVVLNHEDFNFSSGVQSYEDLQLGNKNDRYQYILPYYNFDTVLKNKLFGGSFNFASSGNNDLNNTNQLKSNIINDLSYKSESFISNQGIVNDFNIDLKNLNLLGKNYPKYKSSPQIELSGIFSLNTSYPLTKSEKNYQSFLIPKSSLRINPGDMINYSNLNRRINTGNIFNLNRFGFTDTFEAGRSLTLGLDYKREKIENLQNINNYFEMKIATVIRDEEENFLPNTTTLNKKNSNLFGSLKKNFSDNFQIEYDFAMDDSLDTFEYNNLNTTLIYKDIKTKFLLIKESGLMGDESSLENSTIYSFDDKNSISFNTRRNRKIGLTEYYNLVYEYKNDCLTAGIKYKKTYYEDRDLKPSENLLFTISLFPLTSYEYKAE